MPLPSASELIGNNVTEAQFKAKLTQLIENIFSKTDGQNLDTNLALLAQRVSRLNNEQSQALLGDIASLRQYVTNLNYQQTQNNSSVRQYTDDLHQIQNTNISDLRSYVDSLVVDGNRELVSELLNQLMADLEAAGAGENGWLASLVKSENGQSLQQIADSVGSKWRVKPSGYAIGDLVRLNNGTLVKSRVPNNGINPNLDMTGWIFAKYDQVVDLREYGLIVNTVFDMTPFVYDAMAKNPDACKFYFPEGKILVNIVVPRTHITFVGASIEKTFLNSFDKHKPTIDYNKNLYMGLQDITVNQRYDATAAIINGRDSRYLYYTRASVFQEPNPAGEDTLTVDGLDLRNEINTWTGYLYFNESRFHRCRNGINTDGDLVSATQFNNCVIAWNGEFGAKLINVIGGGMKNCDIATNGRLGERLGEFDETKYGGVYVKGRSFNIDGTWHEYNHSKFTEVDVSNDIYIHPESINVTETNPRWVRNNVGALLVSQSQAEQDRNGFFDAPIDGGMGTAHIQNLLKNSAFKYDVKGWKGINIPSANAAYSFVTDNLPKKVHRALKFDSLSGGVVGFYQPIFEVGGSDSLLSNISQYTGTTISVACWVKNLGTTTSLRLGFDANIPSAGIYFSEGNFISNTPPDKRVKVVMTYKIKGDEPRLMFGFRTTSSALVANFSVQLGPRVNACEPKVLTEDGGTVYGNVEVRGFSSETLKINGFNITFASERPTVAATRGDICFNSMASGGAEIGWRYNGA